MKHAYRILDPATGLPTETPSYSGVPSAEAISEIAGPVGVVAAVATGSLPVLSAEALCCEWEEKARDYQRLSGPCDEAGKIKFTAIADTFWACAAGLRRQMEATTERQPEENAEVSDGGPLTHESPAAQSRRSLH